MRIHGIQASQGLVNSLDSNAQNYHRMSYITVQASDAIAMWRKTNQSNSSLMLDFFAFLGQHTFHTKFNKEYGMGHNQEKYVDMTLRDFLALDRTKLANERTYLGYMRTFISLLASGVGFIRFIEIELVKYVGIALCLISPLFFIVGTWKYYSIEKRNKKT